MSLPLSLTTNTVIGIGTNAMLSPASARACLVSETVALLKNAASCVFSQIPSYTAVHSASPILYRRKPGLGSGVRAFRTGAVGLCWLRIGAAGACWLSTGADRIRFRRDVVIISGPPEIAHDHLNGAVQVEIAPKYLL